MKDKIYDPARHNETAPSKGMAAVNTHMPEETPVEATRSADQETHDLPVKDAEPRKEQDQSR